ncbi:FAD/NAD(P)-binding domain-containing protein [Pholiota conissans]|uniref:FAD/NAD(P)-binding domain-containing protein n=1 Tax=Pholiota conissans TaxID=109636 RepID=A0A9P5YTJ8_9AGAR|nr:FAD/NAD(P)-binding domain-containing protein [Pholiota conissans]
MSIPVPKSVLVIGGGPTGLVSLRNMIERGRFERVSLYERRDDVGGVWYFEDSDKPEDPLHPRWPSPAYKGLIGNVLPSFLSYSEFPFPEPPSTPHQPSPTLVETHQYLQAFAEPYIKSGAIKLNREVVSVEELGDGKGWKVVARDWTDNGKEIEELWDAVVIAIGWYDTPYWPETEGLEVLKTHGLAKHAKWWRGPQPYAGQKVLVVGNANSSNDIAAQLAPVTDGPVYQSIRRTALYTYPSLPNERIHFVAPVSKYTLKKTDKGYKFDALLTDGTTLSDLDSVQIGTGYRLIPNFLRVLDHSPEAREGALKPINDETVEPHRIPELHRLILYARNPSLGFVGAPLAFTPFTIADIASTWLAFAWLGETPYPDTVERRLIFEQERLEAIEKWRSGFENPSSLWVFSILGPTEQEYAYNLRKDIVVARPALDDILPLWNDERTAVRKAMYQKKFEALQYSKNLKDRAANGTAAGSQRGKERMRRYNVYL